MDARAGRVVHSFDSLDDGWGVRCLHSDRDVITVGGALGRISFYDVRAQAYIEWIDVANGSVVREATRLESESSHGHRLVSSAMSLDTALNLTPLSPSSSYSLLNNSSNTYDIYYPRVPPSRSSISSIQSTINATTLQLRHLSSGRGWISRDEVYVSHFEGVNVANAIYTLAYEGEARQEAEWVSTSHKGTALTTPISTTTTTTTTTRHRCTEEEGGEYNDYGIGSSSSHFPMHHTTTTRSDSMRLFAAGGPLQLSLCGSFAGIWG